MNVHATALALIVASALVLAAPTAAAQAFPAPQPAPCAGPNVVSSAVQNLADAVAAAMHAIETQRGGASRAVHDLAEAACAAGDRAALDAVLERCTRECRDDGDRYIAHIDYAGALARFGDTDAAEAQYRAAIALRPGRPPEAIEAYNNYALLLDRLGRPLEALEVLGRFSQEELRLYTFSATLKLWIMRELGMDTSTEQLVLQPPFPGSIVGMQSSRLPFAPAPGTASERPIEPVVVEVREDVTLSPRGPGAVPDGRGQLHFRRMSTRNPAARPLTQTLAQGARFVMIATLEGDGCRIALDNNTYDLVLCPWLLERGDRQRDLYRVRPRASLESAVSPAPALPAPPYALQAPPSDSRSEWATWQRFHRNLELIGRTDPAYLDDVLVRQAGLTSGEATAVRAAGQDYLDQLAATDERARAEIAARFALPAPFEPPLPPTAAGGGDRPRVLVPSRAPDGRSVQEILAEEGFSARLDAGKEALLAAHRARLGEIVGAVKLARLEAVARGDAPAPSAAPPSRQDPEIILLQ